MRLTHRLLVYVQVLLGLALVYPGWSACARANEPTQDELLTLVIGRMRQNYALTRTGDVLADVDIASQKPDGKITHVRWQDHVQFNGRNIRYEQLFPDQTPFVVACNDGIWQWFTLAANAKTPDDNRLTITRIDSLGGMCTFDPRDYAVDDFKESLISLLSSHEISKVTSLDRGEGKRLVEISHRPWQGKKPYDAWERSYTFDSTASYLPVLVLLKDDTGDVKQSVEIAYQRVLDGKALLPKNRVFKSYSIKGVKSAEDNRWVQCLTKTVVRATLNESIDDEKFKTVKVPDGTTVDDQVRGRLYVSGKGHEGTNWITR